MIEVYKIDDNHYAWKFTTEDGEVLIRVENAYSDLETLMKDLNKVRKQIRTAEIHDSTH